MSLLRYEGLRGVQVVTTKERGNMVTEEDKRECIISDEERAKILDQFHRKRGGAGWTEEEDKIVMDYAEDLKVRRYMLYAILKGKIVLHCVDGHACISPPEEIDKN